jgi:uncharacterized protein with PIN domain
VPRDNTATLVVPETLRELVWSRRRADRVTVAVDGVSTVAHLVGSVGIPPRELGVVTIDGVAVDVDWIPPAGAVVRLAPVARPQRTTAAERRFLLDVHLGTLARRLRVLGVDAAWDRDATDAQLVARATAENRVLLSRDRGLLLRRSLRDGAYVRGDRPDDQLADVLDRFRPALAPWTRCVGCNGVVVPVRKDEVADRLQPGTRRTYDVFATCPDCDRIYWRGAHSEHLQSVVERARGG